MQFSDHKTSFWPINAYCYNNLYFYSISATILPKFSDISSISSWFDATVCAFVNHHAFSTVPSSLFFPHIWLQQHLQSQSWTTSENWSLNCRWEQEVTKLRRWKWGLLAESAKGRLDAHYRDTGITNFNGMHTIWELKPHNTLWFTFLDRTMTVCFLLKYHKKECPYLSTLASIRHCSLKTMCSKP